MTGHTVRLLVAILTFTVGVAVVRGLQVIPYLEAALIDRFFDNEGQSAIPEVVLVDIAEDTSEVYRLLINRSSEHRTTLMVLAAETTGCPLYEDDSLRTRFGNSETFHETVKRFMPEVESHTLDDYLANNMTPERLKVSNPGFNYVIVSKSDLPDDASCDFWTRFYKQYPNSSGIVSLSNVGFNQRHDEAFVYAARSCGLLCGQGDYVLLRKINGHWQIVKEENLWVS